MDKCQFEASQSMENLKKPGLTHGSNMAVKLKGFDKSTICLVFVSSIHNLKG